MTGERTYAEVLDNLNGIGDWEWQPNGENLAIEVSPTTGNKIIHFINIVGGETLPSIPIDSHSFNPDFAWSPDSRFIAVGREVQVYEVATGQLVASVNIFGDVVLDWSRDGQYIAAGSTDGIVRIFDVSRIVSNN